MDENEKLGIYKGLKNEKKKIKEIKIAKHRTESTESPTKYTLASGS